MKILFFSPIVRSSAIGRMSRLVVIELLSQGHDVVIVRTEEPTLIEEPTHPFPCQVVPWNDIARVQQLTKQFSLAVYQLGNHYPYHCGCLEWIPTTPGLVCMHDNFLGHLFWSWAERIGRQKAIELLTVLYGSDIAHRFFDHTDSVSFITYASNAAPMTEWIAAMASAVIVHSSWAMNRITRVCPGPVEVVPLPYDAPYLDTIMEKSKTREDAHVIVLTIGHVNHNKRYTSVIEAIGSSPILRSKLSYRIVGAIEPNIKISLQALADQLGVLIEITGPVDDKKLAEEIHNADIMCCLRWPALESASASTIEAMLYGKPAVVMDTGFYHDLPDDCVLKISPDAELSDLQTALERMILLPEARTSVGESARKYAVKTFRPDNYAKRIIFMKQRIDRSAIVNSAALLFSDIMKRWGARCDKSIVSFVTTPLNLFK